MDEFLFTFNEKKLITIPNTTTAKHDFPIELFPCVKPKSQSSLRSFRSRQIKRYDKIIESLNNQKHFIANFPQEIMSQNLEKINQVCLQMTPYSSKTIQDRPKTKPYPRTNRIFTQQHRVINKKKSENLLQTKEIQTKFNISPKLKDSIQTISENNVGKKRSTSLKQAPMVQFPKNDKKLPSVFRVPNRSCEKRRRLVEMSIDQDLSFHSPVKNEFLRKLAANNVKSSSKIECNSEPKKAGSNLTDTKNESQDLNEQEKTPFFHAKK